MKTYTWIGLSICFLTLLACEEKNLHPDLPEQDCTDIFGIAQRIYSNSFESPSDTINWKGAVILYDEAPENGGVKSLYVSGGCLVPHVSYTFDTLEEAAYILLKCWGKNLESGGGLLLRTTDRNANISLVITEKSWRDYETSDSLFCPAGEPMTLELSAGGFASSAMLIDRIELVKVR